VAVGCEPDGTAASTPAARVVAAFALVVASLAQIAVARIAATTRDAK
jgi:hypothetical protein